MSDLHYITLLETLDFPAESSDKSAGNGNSCRFCQGFALSGNTFVGNCFLRIFETAGNFHRKSH